MAQIAGSGPTAHCEPMPFSNYLNKPGGTDAAAGGLYEDQLRQGFRRLRFTPELERIYRHVVIVEAHWPVLVITLFAIAIWTLFAGLDIVRLDLYGRWPLTPDIWLLLALRGGVLIALLACLVPAVRENTWLDWKAFAVYLLLCSGAAFTAAIYKFNGMPAADAAQIVLAMAAFMPMGMRFYQALAASIGMVIVTVIAGLAWLPPELWQNQFSLLGIIIISVPVGAVGAYLREYAHRRQFLLAGILEHQAQFDALTDLANRRLFHRHATAALEHAERAREQLVLAVIDIDHFKNFNDRFGHVAGDVALRHVADLIRDAARRPMDMAARLGGEEFALLLYGSDLEQAQAILEKLRQQIAETALGPSANLTISLGATMPGSTEDLDRLYARADKLLYRSKADGRNRLTLG